MPSILCIAVETEGEIAAAFETSSEPAPYCPPTCRGVKELPPETEVGVCRSDGRRAAQTVLAIGLAGLKNPAAACGLSLRRDVGKLGSFTENAWVELFITQSYTVAHRRN